MPLQELDFPRVPFAPGLEATQGLLYGLPYRPVSFAPEEESDQWIRVGKRDKRRQRRVVHNQ